MEGFDNLNFLRLRWIGDGSSSQSLIRGWLCNISIFVLVASTELEGVRYGITKNCGVGIERSLFTECKTIADRFNLARLEYEIGKRNRTD